MSVKDTMTNAIDTVTASIALSGTTSGLCNLGGLRLFGIMTPGALTGTSLSFLVSVDGTTFNPLYDANGNLVSVSASAGRFIAFDPTLYAAVPYVQVVSNAAEAAARSITLVLRGI